jgi:hypothetical protein
MAEHFGTLGTWISLHTGNPGDTGANEVSGGSPAYARKQTTWGSAVSGLITGSEVVFDVPPGTTVTHVGINSASTSGTFRDWADSADITFTPQGQVKVTPKYQEN